VQKCDRIPLKTHSSLPKQLSCFFILPDSLALALALALESDQFHFLQFLELFLCFSLEQFHFNWD
jgi:hypothetical protein